MRVKGSIFNLANRNISLLTNNQENNLQKLFTNTEEENTELLLTEPK